LIVVHYIGAASAEAGSPDPTPRTFEGPLGPGALRFPYCERTP